MKLLEENRNIINTCLILLILYLIYLCPISSGWSKQAFSINLQLDSDNETNSAGGGGGGSGMTNRTTNTTTLSEPADDISGGFWDRVLVRQCAPGHYSIIIMLLVVFVLNNLDTIKRFRRR